VTMNVYHITYGPETKIVQLHFWGCNLMCRACLLKREIYDCHLTETKDRIRRQQNSKERTPERFLDPGEIMGLLGRLEVGEVIFMGAEPALDPALPQLTAVLHREFSSYNVLLTNGFHVPDLSHIDEVVFSIKAFTDKIHRDYTGASNESALQNFRKLYESGVRLRTESIFIPEYIDGPETEKIARFIAGVDNTIPHRIDAYIPTGDNPWRRPAPGEIENAAEMARNYLKNVSYLTGKENLRYEVVRIF
jgi:pyruvate formate lyase activating enzyme